MQVVDGCRGGWREGWIVRMIETDRNIERCMHYNHLPRRHCNLVFQTYVLEMQT